MYIKRKLALFVVFMMCFSLMPAMTFATDSAPQLTKTAEWVDSEAGTAKITLKVQGDPIIVNNPGVDVVVVMDYSGSMGICNSTNFTRKYAGTDYDWPWSYDYYHYTCAKCGQVYPSTYWDHRYDAPAYCSKNMSPNSRWDKSKTALNSALDQIIPNTSSPNQVAFVAFDSKVKDNYKTGFIKDKNTITGLAGNLAHPYPGEEKGTNYTAGLGQAYDYLNAVKNNGRAKYVIFLSDGEPSSGSAGNNQIANIKALGATIYTIGIELDASADTKLNSYATSNAYHYNVTDLNDLDDVFTNIAQTVSSGVNVTDVVNLDKFDVMSVGTPTSGSASLSTSDLKTVKWNLNNFNTAGDTLEIYIKLNEANKDKYQQFITNQSAGATYVKSDGTTGILAVSSTAPSSEKPMLERSKKTYTITFSAGSNGTLNGTVSYPNIAQTTKWGEAGITVPTPVPNAGYEFDKWTPEIPPGTSAISNSREYVASFKEKLKYTVKFFEENGTTQIGEAQSVYKGSAATKPADPTKAETASHTYTFDKWVAMDGEYTIADIANVQQHMSFKASFKATEKGTMEVSAAGYEGVYDAQQHGITVTSEGATIKYGTVAGTYDQNASPTYKNAGEYEVYYQITRNGYKTVTGSEVVKITQAPASVTTESDSKVYDGSALTNATATLSGIFEGDDVTATADGSQIEVGSSDNTVVIAGADMTNYTITQTLGTLTVTEATLAYEAAGYEGVYDAQQHGITVTSEGATIKYGTVAGTYDQNACPTYKNAGEYEVYYQITRNGYKTVTGSEVVKITQAPASVTTESDSKVYDGSALTNATATLSGIFEGDDVTATATGSQIEVGSSANVVAYFGESVGNYAFTETLGTLTVTKRPITITAGSASKKYDGTPLTNNSYTVADPTEMTGLVEGHRIVEGSVLVAGTQTQVGSSANKASGGKIVMEMIPQAQAFRIVALDNLDGDYGYVTNNYDLKYVDGTLTITKKSSGSTSSPTIRAKKAPADPLLNMTDHFAYIQGYPDGTVKAQSNVTREEVAAVFFRLLDPTYRETIRSSENDFNDMTKGKWSTKHISTLSKGEIIKGYEDASFRPGSYITRAELAAIASRFDALTPTDENKFTDVTGHWAEKEINSAAEKGWVNGYPDNTFKPNQYITRAEFVTLINNVLDRGVTEEKILQEAKQFTDLLKGDWFYEAMQEAVNSHNYDRDADGTETWIQISYPIIEM